MSDTTRILFVDDEPELLRGLERSLHSMRRRWDMVFAGSGQDALEVLSQRPIDVLVSDMRMPGMDGPELLSRAKNSHPGVARIVLSGFSDRERVLRSTDLVHRFLTKPCPVDVLKETIVRAVTVRRLLSDESLRRLISGIGSLPSLPAVYLEIVEKLRSGRAWARAIGDVIARDAAMTAKLLQLANSAFFGLQSRSTDTAEAVGMLGTETVKALVLSMQVFSQFDQATARRFRVDSLWKHSMAVSALARLIAVSERATPEFLADATVGGLLHDIGKLVLIHAVPDRYERALAAVDDKATLPSDTERQLLGATHAEVGAYLLGLWGLPDTIIEAVAFHHALESLNAANFTPLTAVHVANSLVHERDAATTDELVPRIDLAHLAKLGLANRLPAWRDQFLTMGVHDVRESSLC